MSCTKKCQCNYVPKLTAIQVTGVGSGTATIEVLGTFPIGGRFDVCLTGCKDTVCSGDVVEIKDFNADVVRVFDLCANEAKFGAMSVQASRYGILHLVRSLDLPHNALWKDTVSCVPTPITASTTSFASAVVAPVVAPVVATETCTKTKSASKEVA